MDSNIDIVSVDNDSEKIRLDISSSDEELVDTTSIDLSNELTLINISSIVSCLFIMYICVRHCANDYTIKYSIWLFVQILLAIPNVVVEHYTRRLSSKIFNIFLLVYYSSQFVWYIFGSILFWKTLHPNSENSCTVGTSLSLFCIQTLVWIIVLSLVIKKITNFFINKNCI